MDQGRCALSMLEAIRDTPSRMKYVSLLDTRGWGAAGYGLGMEGHALGGLNLVRQLAEVVRTGAIERISCSVVILPRHANRLLRYLRPIRDPG